MVLSTSMRPCSWRKTPRPDCSRFPDGSLPARCASNMPQAKPTGSLSLDLDNQWSYMKTHGDPGWESFPSYLDLVVPRVLDFLEARNLTITVFIVGQDASLEKNRAALSAIAAAGHEIGNHSF